MCDYVLMDDKNTTAGTVDSSSTGSVQPAGADTASSSDTSTSASSLGSNFSNSPAFPDTSSSTTAPTGLGDTGSTMQPPSTTQSSSTPTLGDVSVNTSAPIQTSDNTTATQAQPASAFPETSGNPPNTQPSNSNISTPTSTETPTPPTTGTTAAPPNQATASSTFPNMPSSYGTSDNVGTANQGGSGNQQPQAVISESGGNKPSGPVTTQGKGGSSKFKFYVIIAIIIILGIWGYVAYLYFGNNNTSLKIPTGAINNIVNNANQQKAPENPPTPTAEPTLSYMTENITIINGSVVASDDSGNPTTIIDKKDYPGTGITGFSRVVSSPAGDKICFESLPPSPEPALYYANADGSGVTEVNPNRKNCNWVSETEIVYVNIATEGTPTDIYSYDTTSVLETNLTGEFSSDTIIRTYKIVNVSSDGRSLACDYSQSETETGGTSVGKCEINLTTGEVTNTQGV